MMTRGPMTKLVHLIVNAWTPLGMGHPSPLPFLRQDLPPSTLHSVAFLQAKAPPPEPPPPTVYFYHKVNGWVKDFPTHTAVFTKQCRPHRNGLHWVTGGLCYSHLCRPLWPLLEHRNTKLNTTEWEWPVLKQKWPLLQCSKQATLACVPKNFL